MDINDRKRNYRYFMGLSAWEIGCDDNTIRPIVVNDGPLGLRKPAINDFENQGDVLETVCMLSPSALAASFSKQVCYENGRFLALDCLSKDVDVILAPGINIKRNALCGRNFEYFSEDPFLTGILASQYILGLEENGGAACVKHYAANNQEAYRLTNSSELSLRALNEIYLRAFAYVIEHASPSLLMTSYNRINGVFVNESPYMIQKKLRQDFKYEGLIVSDWTGVVHKGKTIKTGLDVEMPVSKRTPEFIDQFYGIDFDDEDILKRREEVIKGVKKLALKERKKIEYDFDLVHSSSIKLAEESFVLLKNENNYLPFKKDKKALVIGYFASHPRFVGGGSAWVKTHQTISYLDALKKSNIPFDFIEGYDIDKYLLDEVSLIDKFKQYDQILVFVGQYESDEYEGWDRSGLSLHKEQLQLLDFLNKNHINYASVVVTGSVVDISSLKENSSSIIIGYLSGEGMYEALRNTIYGDNNPSGRLPETWIATLDANPIYKDLIKNNVYYSYYDDDIYVGYRYYDKLENKPLLNYEFGEGLSYSTFSYDDFEIDYDGKDVNISLTIHNLSNIDGKDVIQIYVGKKDSTIYRPIKELKTIEKVLINGNSKQRVTISIPYNDLASYDIESDLFKVEKGIYQIYIAKSTKEIIYSSDVEINGDELIENKEPPHLPRKEDPIEFDITTPVEIALNDEKFIQLIKERNPSLDVREFFNNHAWMLKEPIKNITFNAELNIDFFLLQKYYK